MKHKSFSFFPMVFLLIFILSFAKKGEAKNIQPTFSTAGFYELANTGREVYSMNPAWRFHKGPVEGAEMVNFNDRSWSIVSLPNGIEYLPTEASGCINYQGEIWYRKHFKLDKKLQGKKLFLHFEAIMGKSKIFINGKLYKEHFGGYLPIVVDVTDALSSDKDNVIAVWADNSNDPIYPPGKPQESLDFTYFGGIYRDCWLISCNHTYITDPNYEDKVAGGGLFVAFDKVSEKSAEILLQTHIDNDNIRSFNGTIEYDLLQSDGKKIATSKQTIHITKAKAKTIKDKITIKNPLLWSPESPTLYNLLVRIRNRKGIVVDGYRKRIGIRSIEFKGKDGFWLNGKPYNEPLIGANRHQDFAIVGHAIANSIHWRDAKKLRDVGLKVIRNAHCPQDPAFMDACDELGLFVIINTPGWQFWNKAPIFAQRVYNDIRNLVRRDRDHASAWLWEPILNETWYPTDFAKKTHDIVDEEYPFSGCYSACDSRAQGHENYSILFEHPSAIKNNDPSINYFTREWGDNVDDWSSHNSTSRTARNWGEYPMLIQAQHYALPSYPSTSYNSVCSAFKSDRRYLGGCLWHSFDHQRGYHPDPFYGGIMDVFRQPKYSYHMFMSQRSPILNKKRPFETGPMVYIAHAMTPFSPKDVTVYSNCDEVHLTYIEGGKAHVYKRSATQLGMPSPIITFKDVYDFMVDKKLSRKHEQAKVFMLAEGFIDGEIVATHKVYPARRPEKLLLWLDNEGTDLKADGSDFVTVIAAVADKNGNIKRLNNYHIKFQIEGEGHILGGKDILANPAPIKWGTAPILVQSTLKAGKIRITAKVLFEGSQKPTSAILEFESKPAAHRLIYDAHEEALVTYSANEQNVKWTLFDSKKTLKQEQAIKAENAKKLKAVEQQQEDFGE